MQYIELKKVYINKDELTGITAIENDINTRFVNFQFLAGQGNVLDITRCIVRIYAVNSSGNEIFNDLKIVDGKKGIAQLELTASLLYEGTTNYQLKIFTENKGVLSSNIFEINSKENLMKGTKAMNSSEYNSLIDALGKVGEFNNIKIDVEENRDSINYVDLKISKIISGSPKGVFNTLTDLKNAKPNGEEGIYITKDNGNWNYWDGSDWISGGVYQAATIPEEIEKSIGIYKLKDNGKVKYGFYTSNGEFRPNTSEYETYYCVCGSRERFKVTGAVDNQYTQLITFFRDDTFVSYLEQGSSENPKKVFKDYEFIVPEGVNKFAILTLTSLKTPVKIERLEYVKVAEKSMKNQNDINNIEANLKSLEYDTNVFEKVNVIPKTGFYDNHGVLKENGTYETYEFICKEGDVFRVTGCVENKYTALIRLFDDTTLVDSLEFGTGINEEGRRAIKNYIFKIPRGVNKIAVLNIPSINKGLIEVRKILDSVVRYIKNDINNIEVNLKILREDTNVFEKVNISPQKGFYDNHGTFKPGGGTYETYELTCKEGDLFKVNGCVENQYTALVRLFEDDNLIKSLEFGIGTDESGRKIIKDYVFEVPEGVNKFALLNIPAINEGLVQKKEALDKAIKDIRNEIEEFKVFDNSFWTNKKIVWFGTSIPAGGYLGLDNPNSYPMIVGKLLGANITNEAVGSSSVCCRKKSQITSENPYGFNPNFEQVSRSLGNTREEMQWVIDNYNASFWTNKPKGGLTEELKAQILKNSFEYKLDRHLGEGNRADLYVFDHGHNEDFWIPDANTEPENLFDRYYIQGAFNFIINRILEDNPRAKIIMIGEYEKQKNPGIKKIQETCSNFWSLPLMPLYDLTGWSQREVTTKGYWRDGLWYLDGENKTKIKILDTWLADHIHPHSDKTGRANNYLANLIATWINSNVRIS
ncbi:MAG: hypothetical protein E6545_18040 [Clostridioides difficile]|nr:hypothetical protein [Clostridioides difficile]